jgi:uncharacterized protein (TIGR02678 family)
VNVRARRHAVAEAQSAFARDEFRRAVRALLMQPLLGPQHEDFASVRRQADRLRDWFARETGWALHVDRQGARLYKRPADLDDATRGLPDYERNRYVLLCLACAALDRAEPQITLQTLGDRLLSLAAEPALAERGFAFHLRSPSERRDLVHICKTLLDLGVLRRVVGDEESFIHGAGAQADALYDVHRHALAGMLAAVRGPSSWPESQMPHTLDERLHALVSEYVADSEDGRRTAMRHRLARRLLDDPVVYFDSLDDEARAYFANQRGVMATRLCDAAGLVAEQRAEGLALVDETGALTDVAMPAEGTEAHATLLVAEYLADHLRREPGPFAIGASTIATVLGDAKERYGRYWRKSAREPGAEHELAGIAIDRLEKLNLVRRDGSTIRARPALARFALGTEIVARQQAPGIEADA